MKMSRCKSGNPKRQSRFICMKCMNENMLARGIQRKRQREKFHVKDLTCMLCSGNETKNMEVRYCDDYKEIYEKALEKRENYYTEDFRKVG
jgi:hypothetical protein